MRINENYNSTKQKYGVDLVNTLSKLGLPPQYLLSACRFVEEDNVNSNLIVNYFRDWMTYVARYYNIDVNNLTYDEFIARLTQGKLKHIVPFENVSQR